MKNININGRDYNLTDEAHSSILFLLNKGGACRDCEQVYTELNQEAVKNLCLNCVIKRSFKENGKKLKFLKSEEVDGYTKYTKFYFISELDNFIYTSLNNSEQVSKNVDETLKHYDFSFPINYELNGKSERLYNEWQIWGDLTKDEVLLITQQINYWNGDKFTYKVVEYFTFKNNGYKEVNRRKKEVQKAFRLSGDKATESGKWYWRNDKAYINEFITNNPDLY
jgi:hypothetical protein